jgi:hypothetical protein
MPVYGFSIFPKQFINKLGGNRELASSMGREDYLFAEGNLDATLRAHQGTIGAKIDAIPRDQFMNAQPEEIIDHVLSAMTVDRCVFMCSSLISTWRSRPTLRSTWTRRKRRAG